MKFEFEEHLHGSWITLTPETPKEVAQLLRVAKNTKAQKPDIYFSFSTDIPNLSIGMMKIKESVQVMSIKPSDKKR